DRTSPSRPTASASASSTTGPSKSINFPRSPPKSRPTSSWPSLPAPNQSNSPSALPHPVQSSPPQAKSKTSPPLSHRPQPPPQRRHPRQPQPQRPPQLLQPQIPPRRLSRPPHNPRPPRKTHREISSPGTANHPPSTRFPPTRLTTSLRKNSNPA